MVETTRRKAIVGIGGLLMIGGCSDAVDDDDETEANGANGLDESDDDDANGASGDGSDLDESEDSEDDEPLADDENETTEPDDENETTEDGADEADDGMSTEEFVTQLETGYSGEVGDYDEDDTHGVLTLVTEDEEMPPFELMSDIDGVLSTYSTYVETGDAPTQQLEGEVETTDGSQEVDNFTVETEWVEAYNRGELSEEELQNRVLETVET